jgi:ELP3 family radical SAM enzyme/protein acetyltransferase
MNTSNLVEHKNFDNCDIENIRVDKATLPDENKMKMLMRDFLKEVGLPNMDPKEKDISRLMSKLRNKYKINPTKSHLRYIYEKHMVDEFPELNYIIGRYLIKRSTRSRSGVLVSTITLKPDKFSCPKKCSYCPTETDLNGVPTQPKSYLSSEPAMLRALQYNFDIKGQLWDRIRAYIRTGNILNTDDKQSYKLEMILSGGTWESYSYDYRNEVMHSIYYAANTFDKPREMLSFEQEITINETAKFRIIGLTIETRPDFITRHSIKDYRRWGVTRVQIGVQHYDDGILNKINRECFTKDTIKAIKMLKQTGFKVVCHLMPDLPGSSPQLDEWMFNQAISNPDLQFDDVKIYPTAICKSNDPNLLVKSDIADWYASGEYKPYAEKDITQLVNVLKNYKKNIQPWIRIQRLVRDIPSSSIEAGYEKKSNLRQMIADEMKAEGTRCRCIRCMEIGDEHKLMENAKLIVRQYEASGGIEYQISIESNEQTPEFKKAHRWFIIQHFLYKLFLGIQTYWSGHLDTYNGIIGFCRLRIDNEAGGGIIKELEGSALIREVHVYGYSLGVGNCNNGLKSSQHKGFGKLLVKKAEELAVIHGLKKIAVIAGVGTREYYKNKCGYNLEGTYMVKDLREELIKQIQDETLIPLIWFSILGIIVMYCIVYM